MNKIIFIAMVVMISAASCKKDEPTPFIAKPAINFVDTNIVAYEYSFLGNPESEYIYELPVYIIGNATDYDRTFNAVAVKDTATTAPDELYEILGGEIKAGQFRGVLKVKLKNAPELSSTKVSLRLKINSSDDFEVGTNENSTFIVRWTGQVVIPSWTIFRLYFTAVASTRAYNLIVYITGLKTLSASEHSRLGVPAAQSLATAFGDYVKQWNLDHPDDILVHDDGTRAGQAIEPLYYTRSKYD